MHKLDTSRLITTATTIIKGRVQRRTEGKKRKMKQKRNHLVRATAAPPPLLLFRLSPAPAAAVSSHRHLTDAVIVMDLNNNRLNFRAVGW
jgi:hypothetical protein